MQRVRAIVALHVDTMTDLRTESHTGGIRDILVT